MDKAIESSPKKGMAAGYLVHDKPPNVEHCDVVVDVKKGNLMVALSENEEKSVHKLNNF